MEPEEAPRARADTCATLSKEQREQEKALRALQAKEELQAQGIESKLLAVGLGFHSSNISSAMPQLRERVAARVGRLEVVGVDPDRADRDRDDAPRVLDARRVALEPEDARADDEEVRDVVEVVERDEVGAEHAVEQRLAHGQDAVELGRRERALEEEAARDAGEALAQHRGQQHELVVVHEHEVALIKREGGS